MKIVAVKPAGVCMGVRNAIKIVNELIEKNVKPIYLYSPLVHNKKVMDDFKNKGVLEYHGEKEGTLVTSAHGISKSIVNSLKSPKLNVIITTCPWVTKNEKLLKQYEDLGYTIFYIGIMNHPESMNAIRDLKDVYLITDDSIPKVDNDKIFVTNQTTLNYRSLSDLHEKIKKVYPNAIIANELCYETRIRQENLIKANSESDLCFVVGDKSSNNVKSLKSISENQTGTKTIIIESYLDIDLKDLSKDLTVSVVSGASTPDKIFEEVINFLEKY